MRRRRPMFLALAILAAFAGLASGALVVAVKRDPAFYATAAKKTADWDSHERSTKFLTRVLDLQNDIRAKAEWGDTFTTEELNCFFTENMGAKDGLSELLPKGFHSPRIAIEGDHLKLGLRYGEGFWSSVVWMDLKVWLVADQVNVAAVEVCALQAGGLPFGSQSILDKIGDVARESSIDVTWYRNKSNPVGLFRFFSKQPRPTSQVLTLDVKDGKLIVAGRSFLDPAPALPTGVNPPPTP
ncbi:hypothetical protein VT84_29065 [Gemmata sp. SH-PL17]|uniref:hypothetical protein n=1 Tax=Gemmata sp. SH-PL17 TaxID=1630693 RepID=UPI00078DC84F|nr:hypothetical protein [Gemmata sp. SH-PL17]AMV28491.1 hypothetical protein VT84_29065 [Gemmata sp. SH-PL17]